LEVEAVEVAGELQRTRTFLVDMVELGRVSLEQAQRLLQELCLAQAEAAVEAAWAL